MGKKVLIIGGVAGGASAATRLRRLDEEAEIILVERGSHVSFANCGLPYYIGDVITDRERLLVQTPTNMKELFNLDVRINSEVVSINPSEKTVLIESKESGSYQESYDVLVLSPGAKPIKPPIPGIASEKIFTLRNLEDMDQIKQRAGQSGVRKVVVVGGGFIGVEMAENLHHIGLEVTLVESAPHILAPFDEDMVCSLEKELTENGIHLQLNDGVASFSEQSGQLEVRLKSGTTLEADQVILAIGVAPDTHFLRETGIQLGEKGHIIVDDQMRTSLPDIYAVGDAIEVKDFVTGQSTQIPLAGPANKQGRIAADNIAGIPIRYKGTQGTSIIKVFSLTGGATGNTERNLKRLGIAYQATRIHPFSHATYYPGAFQNSFKLLFDHEGKILGAQGVGYEGVDKTIDVIAAVMRLQGTIYDLAELEHTYAPPYSSAKDAINMLGFTAENLLTGRTETFTYESLKEYNLEESILVDVRSPIEFELNHLEGALNIPLESLRDRMSELDQNKLILVYCKVGLKGYTASRMLSQRGFKVKNMSGGLKSALAGNDPVQPPIMPLSEAAISPSLSARVTQSLDACGLSCPGPLIKLKVAMDSMAESEILEVTASDPGFTEDVKSWCSRTGNNLLHLSKEDGVITAQIRKGAKEDSSADGFSVSASTPKENKTIVVFSGDLDKALAAFIIANGAASMGKKVTLFFTFWGLNILRKTEDLPVKKNFVEKMFGLMMPQGSKKLTLSKMNMFGMGTKMIRMVMKDKNISSLEELIYSSTQMGVELVACQMSMDVMGIHKEELLDGVKIGGVGYYLGEAEDSNVNLFI